MQQGPGKSNLPRPDEKSPEQAANLSGLSVNWLEKAC